MGRIGQSSQTQTTQATVPAWYENFVAGQVLPTATRVANTPFEQYGGEFTAGVSPLALGAQTQFQQIADIANMSPEDYAARTAANMSPFQSQVIDAALARSARERDIARTGEMAQITQANAFGNDRRGVFEAERAAAYDVARDQLVAGLMQQGYNQAQAATMAQLQMGQGAAGQAAAGMMQLGNLEQLTRQAELDAQYQEFLRRQNYPLQQLGALVSASSGVQVPMGSTTTQTSRPGFSGILGALGSAGQAFSLFGSDRRLKKNIRRIGSRDGVAFYSWDWNDLGQSVGVSDHPTVGVLADELERAHPDLVHMGPHGFKMVDYGGLQDRLTG